MNKNLVSFALTAALTVSATTLHALPLADTIISFTGGSGFGVADESDGRYTGMSGEGIYDPLAVTALDGAVLGLGGAIETPGTIIMRFSAGEIFDGAGPDLRIYDTHFFLDGFRLDISADGSDFTNTFFLAGDLGVFTCSLEFPCVTDVDISGTGLTEISYLKIAAGGNSAQSFPEAFTLDAVEALNFRSLPVSEPGTLALFGIAVAALTVIRRRRS